MFALVAATATTLALLVHYFGPRSILGLRNRLFVLVIIAAAGTAFAMVPDQFFRASQRPRPAVSLQLTSFLSMALFGIAFVLGMRRGVNASSKRRPARRFSWA